MLPTMKLRWLVVVEEAITETPTSSIWHPYAGHDYYKLQQKWVSKDTEDTEWRDIKYTDWSEK